MHRLNKFISMCLTAVVIITSVFGGVNLSVTAATVTTAYIEGDNVRVRTGPSTNETIIEKISYRSVTVLEKVNNDTWLTLSYTNGTADIVGYIFYDSSYIRIVS